MRISKFVHSCLLVEHGDVSVLIDPGIYTFQEKALDVSHLPNLSYLVITHEHPDHLYPPLVKEIVRKFPDIEVISNASVSRLLKKEGISVSMKGNSSIETKVVPHEKIVGFPVPENIQVNVFGRLTHPGDSLSFSKTREILAIPIQAPWGSYTWAIEKVLALKPKFVIPIHDWHWRDAAREALYQRSEEFLGEHGILFKPGAQDVVFED